MDSYESTVDCMVKNEKEGTDNEILMPHLLEM